MPRATAIANLSNGLATDVTVRRVTDHDGPALARLAALDSRPLPVGPCLVAEVAGVLWAARSLTTGEVVADPFRPTADLVALLHQRARHLRQADAAPRAGAVARLAAGLRLTRPGMRSG